MAGILGKYFKKMFYKIHIKGPSRNPEKNLENSTLRVLEESIETR